MKNVKDIMIFGNGNSMVFDDNGEQIPELQTGWFRIYIEWLQSKGVNVENVDFEIHRRKVKIIKTENEFNWVF